ncbi:hypothetical protein ABPG77_006666 [Micractinium sp. CCAP 211/92]
MTGLGRPATSSTALSHSGSSRGSSSSDRTVEERPREIKRQRAVRRPTAKAAKRASPGAASATGRERERTCRVPGCTAELAAGYQLKYRICSTHYVIPAVAVGEHLCRFCQQCSKLHALVEFDADRRSCRSSLEKHQQRPSQLPRMGRTALAANLLSAQEQQPLAQHAPVQLGDTRLQEAAALQHVLLRMPPNLSMGTHGERAPHGRMVQQALELLQHDTPLSDYVPSERELEQLSLGLPASADTLAVGSCRAEVEVSLLPSHDAQQGRQHPTATAAPAGWSALPPLPALADAPTVPVPERAALTGAEAADWLSRFLL